MAPRITGVEDFSGDCSRDAPGNCDEHTPNSSVPAADVRAFASFVCARAHRGECSSGLFPPIPGPRACRCRGRVARGGRLTAGESGRGEAHSLQRDSPSQAPARRFAAGACGSSAQHTQNGPAIRGKPQVRTFLRAQPGAPLRLPTPGHHPLPRSTRPRARGLGDKRRVVAHCRWQGRTRPLTPSPHGLAVAATPRAAAAVHLRRLLPDPNPLPGGVVPDNPGSFPGTPISQMPMMRIPAAGRCRPRHCLQP